ncbi:HNH homing endonuclease [Salmonella phage vB_SenS_SB9]|uniref:HNH homing endonuclease n=1 Tax=Salmonella phage vB_SenS_SB9 TaxID=2588125 RepID=A0A514A299_9CAUD|nr:HNH homing endonuclease [Salmonella phage vB_SenS_SB9]
MTNHKPLLPLEEYQSKFDYDPETGIFTWNSGSRRGKPAGGHNDSGISLSMGSKGKYKAHRVAWLYMTGEDPGDLLIDHKDQDPWNNKWNNLRKATNKENSSNSSGWENKSTGVKGIYKRTEGKFEARIRANGKRINVGTFGSLEEAESAIREAREKVCGEFTNHG